MGKKKKSGGGGGGGGGNNDNTTTNNSSSGNNSNSENNSNSSSNNNNSDNKGETEYINMVLKCNLHCDGCKRRITKALRSLSGVGIVEMEGENKVKIMATKKVDPIKVRDKLQKKTGKMVDLISPLPSKNDASKTDPNKPTDLKPKELPLTTVVLKIPYHCLGCAKRTSKTVKSYEGVHEVRIDNEKDLVTVKGRVDAKKMVEELKRQLKRHIEIVPEKKEKEGGGNNNDGKSSGGGGGGGRMGGDWVIDHYAYCPGQWYAHEYSYSYLAAPQMFSDENPNACSIM